ncbi:ATP-binding protein [Sphaerisporangium rubeum]|uniref:Histidine kinase/HSP90-like ATPase domain-containing protein n=1 Tax=Sphaerisporangium rubeum TaxID=321317 RepID=A0A7X0M5Q5_9ACTN|nr:ATP-binding protein [Sphaerisporangium rubeum]MBB6471199.1 hypothetical protein [Sphaerisporangium rubeum]
MGVPGALVDARESEIHRPGRQGGGGHRVTGAAQPIVHTDSPTITVKATTTPTGDLHIEVTDNGAETLPTLHPQSPDTPSLSGRGIHLIRTLATHWGFTQQPEQSTLWFVLSPYDAVDPHSTDTTDAIRGLRS